METDTSQGQANERRGGSMTDLSQHLSKSFDDLITLFTTELTEKNRLLLETQKGLLIQQDLTQQARKRIRELEANLSELLRKRGN